MHVLAGVPFKTVSPFVRAMTGSRPLWFLTGNEGKLAEAQHFLSPLGFQVQTLQVGGITPEVVEPQAEMLEEVARAKLSQARAILEGIGKAGEAVMVEDAGLFVKELGGFPGVYSAYVLATLGNEGLLRLFDEDSSRIAEFRSVAALWDGERQHVGLGVCPGRISTQVVMGNGFGFDPIFIPDDLDSDGIPLPNGKVGMVSTDGIPFGGVSLGTKQKFSHRRRAMAALVDRIGAPSA